MYAERMSLIFKICRVRLQWAVSRPGPERLHVRQGMILVTARAKRLRTRCEAEHRKEKNCSWNWRLGRELRREVGSGAGVADFDRIFESGRIGADISDFGEIFEWATEMQRSRIFARFCTILGL